MKTELNLNAYGVRELNVEEMVSFEGGNFYRALVKILELVGVLDLADALVEGIVEGVKEGYNDQQNKK